MRHEIKVVLFDLDGTLLDTAPDLAAALNYVRAARAQPPLSLDVVRPVVSNGTGALLRLGLDIGPEDTEFSIARAEFLDHYLAYIADHSRLFPGMEMVLLELERRGLAWGVVTNKPAFLTDPLLHALGLYTRAGSVVSGDTTPERKPHPEPLYHACRVLGCRPGEAVYVGDAARDIEAACRAGMPSLIAAFGYIDAEERPETWGADGVVETPGEILLWLDTPVHRSKNTVSTPV